MSALMTVAIFCVTSGRASVGEQNDWLSTAGYLDCAQGGAVGYHVWACDVLDRLAFKPVSHAVGVYGHGVGGIQECVDA